MLTLTTSVIKSSSLIYLLLLLSIPSIGVPMEEPLGKTLLARGDIQAERQGENQALKRLSPVFQRDIIRSGSNAAAQFRMIDNAYIELDENSELRLESYEPDTQNQHGSVVMELLSGGLRTISGLFGKKDKSAYQLKTPSALIGIRGTMYEVKLTEEGMYLAAWKGNITVQSYSGRCNMAIGAGQRSSFALVNAAGDCETLIEPPRVFSQNKSTANTASEATTSTPPAKNAQAPSPATTKPVVVTEEVEITAPPIEIVTPPVGKPFNTLVMGQGNTQIARANANSYRTPNPTIVVGTQTLSAKAGANRNYWEKIGGYPVTWGQWATYNTQTATNAPATPVHDADGMQWVTWKATATDTVAARTGTARYDSMVNNLSQSSMGDVNQVAVQMDVDFGSGHVSNGVISANVPDHTWIGTFNGQVQSGDLSLNFLGGSLVNVGNAVSHAVGGFIDGDFVGNNAQAVAGGFSMFDQTNNANQIHGSFLVEDSTAR